MNQLPIAVRDDGFTWLYAITPPCTIEKLRRKCVDHLAGIAQIREIGVGVGFAMNFRSRRGELLGEDMLPPDILERLCENPGSAAHVQAVCDDYHRTHERVIRPGDFRVSANIRYLLNQGTSPFRVVAERSHELGMRVWGRIELRAGLPRCLAGQHACQIPGRADLDFRHEAVRTYYLDLFEDILHEGADGISLDYCVYPPFFEHPQRDGGFMTQLLRDMRARFTAMGRKIDIAVRLPYHPEQYGLFWRDWVEQELVDVIIPSVILPGELFDVPIDEYVRATRGTSCRVFGCMRPKMTSINPDPKPNDERLGVWRFNRPNTQANDAARAALLLASGADGLQIGLGTAFAYDPSRVPGTNPYTDAWQPYFSAYAHPESLRFANKTYPLVNAAILPQALTANRSALRIPFRIADNFAEAAAAGLCVSVSVCPVMRMLRPHEQLHLSLNGGESLIVDAQTLGGDMRPPIVFNHDHVVTSEVSEFDDGWWLKGRKEIAVDPASLTRGDNFIDLAFVCPDESAVLALVDIDVEIHYTCRFPSGDLPGLLCALSPYTGRAIENHLSGPQKEAFRLNWAHMAANYGSHVDAALLDRQILLCDATADALYDRAWTHTRYVRGTRPRLEALIHRLISPQSTPMQQTLAIMNFCRDLYEKNGGRILFYGGTEEELIEKGEQLCECDARLMVALCEIAGIPARIITHTVGGHLTCEAYVDGEWGYFDPRTGFYCVKADGKPASLLELLRHPQLLDQQPDAVKANLSARWTWEMRAARCRERFFNPYEVNTIKPYSLADSTLYTYGWTTNRDLDRAGLSRINAAYAAAGDQTFGTRSSPRQPRLELTLPDGVLLAQPVPVLALPRDLCVPPRALRFSIDGEVVWTSPAVIPPSDVHICMEGAIPLFGERGLLDPSAFGEGVHTLFVQDINDESVYGQTTFLIQRSLQLP